MFKYPCYPPQYLGNVFLNELGCNRAVCVPGIPYKSRFPKVLSRPKPFRGKEKAPAGRRAPGTELGELPGGRFTPFYQEKTELPASTERGNFGVQFRFGVCGLFLVWIIFFFFFPRWF